MADSFAPNRPPGQGFLERQVATLLDVMDYARCAERLSNQRGLLQRFDPRVRLAGMLAVIALAVSTHRPVVLCGLFAASVAAAVLSHVPLRLLGRGVWLNVLPFSGLLALPAVFLVAGDVLFRLPGLGLQATLQGAGSALFLVGRAMTTTTVAALTILVTPWPQILKALRTLRLPAVAVAILSMTYRYIFVALQMALDMLTARRSRLIGRLSAAQRRRMLVTVAGVLLGKSMQVAEGVFLAMQSRGYRGNHRILTEFRMMQQDWFALAAILSVGAVLYFHG